MLKQKFTLLELMIVIAVIGILCTLLMPSIAKARSKAEQAVCLSNQRQISIATTSFISTNNGVGPADEDNKHKRWYSRLIPAYLPTNETIENGASSVQNCPSANELQENWQSAIAMNTSVTGKTWKSGGFSPPKNLYKATPDETCMIIDSKGLVRKSSSWLMTTEHLINSSPKERIARHLEKANVGYLDGSVKAKSYTYLLTKNSNADTFWDIEQ